jgi:hexosaminidase
MMPDSPASVSIPINSVLGELIPKPLAVEATGGTFTITAATQIVIAPATDAVRAIGELLAERLRPATGFSLPVIDANPALAIDANPAPAAEHITLTTVDGDPVLGAEGYVLAIAPGSVTITAAEPAGLFYGVQTLRQLLPPNIEQPTAQESAWTLPGGTIRDTPRFEWRGAMLDVSRHFFGVDDVKRYIDLLAYYKLNRLHLHLSDDQGWRIAINSWPNLATYGGSTQVGGGSGGFYTQAEYTDIVAYAQQRYIMIIPEIDLPGHTNAALASYPELNCNDVAPPLYTGTQVGFSTLCADKEITYTFVDDVMRELAALTPGPYLHIGGDEAAATDPDDYVRMIERFQAIVQSHGKRMIGWEEVSRTKLLPESVVQFWHNPVVGQAISQGAKVIMSPADRIYLDMQYDTSTPLGLHWAAYIDVRRSYNWDPATAVADVPEDAILGVEAPIWSETLETIEDVEYMAFPRLLSSAEISWSPMMARDWEDYGLRLAAHGPRLDALGVNFHRTKEIPWQ